MKKLNVQKVALGAAALIFGHIATASAAHCPTVIQRDSNGFWTSSEAPGWKSTSKASIDKILTEKSFGGAVYSVVKKRIACVYRGSDNRWVAVISSVYQPIEQDNLAKMGAWKYSRKYKDYVCGKPESRLMDCSFQIR